MKPKLTYAEIRANAVARGMRILKLRSGGLTYREIAEQIGVNKARCRDIYEWAKRIENRKPDWRNGLYPRLRNHLINLRLETKEDAVKALQSGLLHPNNRQIYGYGWSSHRALAKELGLPVPEGPAPKVCPHCGGNLNFLKKTVDETPVSS